MELKTLDEVVREKPFEDYYEWWEVGDQFMAFMSQAIVSEWRALPGNDGDTAPIAAYTGLFLKTVYKREPRENLVSDFLNANPDATYYSGEFDALSYALYRSAFEIIAANIDQYENSLEVERRLFTKRVGKIFFDQVHDTLALDLPAGLSSEAEFQRAKENVERVGAFLVEQGYLRDLFEFPFDVEAEHNGTLIQQAEADFVTHLHENGVAHAMYVMGYPIILPSAVYLYHTIGEAQHHSSRTIEELFDRIGYEARETDDFDPIGYPSDRVVELWEIRKLV